MYDHKRMVILFLSVVFLTFFMNYKNAKLEAFAFQKQVEMYQKTGDDIELALQEGYEILEEASGNQGALISNPISYHYELLNKAIFSLSNKYAFSLMCEGGLIFLPILCSYFGLIWVTSDLKNKTLRNRSLRLGKEKAFFSKQLSGLMFLLFVFLITIIASFIIQSILRSLFFQNIHIDIEKFTYTTEKGSSAVSQFFFSAFIILFYYEFGFTFGNLLKGNPVSIIIVSIYIFVIPPFFKYDIANICNNYAREIFNFSGAFHLNEIKDVSLLYGGIELIGVLMLFLICNFVITKKRSAYV